MIRLGVSLLLVCTIAACATAGPDLTEEVDALARAPVCCKSPDELRFEPVPLAQRLEFDLDAKSPAFVFSGEKSFFRAFELPRSDRKLVVTIEANMPWKGFPREYAMFYPVVDFLNERRELAFTLPADVAGYVRWDIANADRLLTTRLVHPEDGWRYFVVYTTPEALKAGRNSVRVINPRTTTTVYAGQGIFFPVPIAPVTERPGLPAAPMARIKVTVTEHGRLP